MRVVDLVRAGVGEVLALEVEAQARDGRRAARIGRAVGQPPGRFGPDRVGQAVGPIERRRAPGERGEQLAKLRPEDGVLTKGGVGGLELLEGRHQRLGHIPAAEIALHPPPAGAVRVEEARVDGRRPERDVRADRHAPPGPAW